MTLASVLYLSGAAAGAAAVGLKLRRLRHWGSPQLWAMCMSYALAATEVWAASPSTIVLLNRATGVSNFTAIFTYCVVAAFAGSALTLAMLWRYPPAEAWPKVRAILGAYALAITAMIVLFSVSDVAVERQTDFMTYYAGQPTVCAMLLIFVTATAVGEGIISYGCLSWARSDNYADRPWLRRGLLLFGIATGIAAVEFTEMFTAVSLAASGVHWLDTFNTILPMVVVLPGMLLALAAVILPVWGPRVPVWRERLRRWQAYRTLRPMHRALAVVDPAQVFVAAGKRRDPYHRVRRQLIELGDFRWTLSRRFDPAVAETARRLGEQAGLSGEELQATAEAAQLRAALTSRPATGDAGAGQAGLDEAEDGTDVVGELARWLRVAEAWDGPVVVAALRLPVPQTASTAS